MATGTFKFDGREYPANHGYTVKWEPVDARTWQLESRLNGNTATRNVRLTVSGDEKTLTIAATNDTFTLTRVSGRSGLTGRWLGKQATTSRCYWVSESADDEWNRKVLSVILHRLPV